MRLVSLEINNFRVIRKVRISFPDKVIGVIGPNGAGKSSIIEAISWALYGNQAARTGKDEIKSSFATASDSCQVTLEFSVNDQLYKVVRRLAGRTEKAEVELYRGEMSESVGVNETRAYVGQLLGLDWRGFLSSFLARQAELNALSDLQPSKRRDHIAGMLGIERLDRAIQKVKEDGRLFKEKGSFLERQIIQKETVEKRITELLQDIEKLDGPLAELRAELGGMESLTKQYTEKLEKDQKKKDDHARLQSSIEAEQRTLENLTEQSRTLQSELDQLGQSRQELAGLAEKLAEYTSVKKEHDSLIQARSHVAVRDELLKRQKSEQEQIVRYEQNVHLLEERLSEMDGRLKKLPEDLDRQLASKQEMLEKARDEYSRLRAEQESGKKQVGKLNEQLSSIGKLGPDSVCERCRRPFGGDYETIKAHISEEVALLNDTVSGIEAQLEKQRTSGEDLRKLVAELEKKKNDRYQLLTQHQSTAREKESAAGQLEQLRQSLKNTGKQLQEYSDITFDSTRFKVIEASLEELEKLKERHDQLKGRLVRLPDVEKALAELARKKDNARSRLEDLQEQTDRLGFDERAYQDSLTEFDRAKKSGEETRAKYLERSKEKELLEKELEGKREQLKSFEQAQVELEKSRTDHYHAEKLSGLFNDFRQNLIASIRPSLAEISSRLLSEMTDGKYSMVDLDEKYNLKVMDSGVYFGVDRFSGGEKDLANLCLRLAISLALTESAGLTRSFVILDEVFGSQDNQRKELILKAMGQLKQRFPQILLITHVDDVKDGVEEIIEVLPSGNGWSEVRVNGSAV